MATRLSLRTDVRNEILEPTAGFWADSEINEWLQEANDDLTFVARIESSNSPYTFETVAGTDTYAMPSDFSRARLVSRETRAGSGQYVPLRAGRIDERVPDQSTPQSFYLWNATNLVLVPKPNIAMSMQVWYYKTSTQWADDTGVPDVPLIYHRLLKLYAIGIAKRKADDPAFQQYLADYEAGKNDMVQKLQDRGEAQQFQVVRDDWYMPQVPDPRTTP